MEDMRLALTEQEETQEQMEQVLEEKLNLIQELSSGRKKKSKKNMKSKQFGFHCFELERGLAREQLSLILLLLQTAEKQECS